MKIIRIGRLSIYLEITPKKDPKALEKLLEMRRNKPLDPLTKLWDNEEDDRWDERPTPVLKGKSAKRFYSEINNGEISPKQKKFLDDCLRGIKND